MNKGFFNREFTILWYQVSSVQAPIEDHSFAAAYQKLAPMMVKKSKPKYGDGRRSDNEVAKR